MSQNLVEDAELVGQAMAASEKVAEYNLAQERLARDEKERLVNDLNFLVLTKTWAQLPVFRHWFRNYVILEHNESHLLLWRHNKMYITRQKKRGIFYRGWLGAMMGTFSLASSITIGAIYLRSIGQSPAVILGLTLGVPTAIWLRGLVKQVRLVKSLAGKQEAHWSIYDQVQSLKEVGILGRQKLAGQVEKREALEKEGEPALLMAESAKEPEGAEKLGILR